jgi:ubiquinone/menaquinone biosynthesis C-methylase UbiE
MDLDPDVLRHYQLGGEDGRLVRGGTERLELLRTKELLARHLPPGPLDVLDIGGGSGRYAAWLAGLGHRVHLVDPVPLHVEQARARGGFTVAEGDARQLTVEDVSADVVLLLGPLYHLPEVADRRRALAEALRVLRPGGRLFAAAVSRFASSLDGMKKGFVTDAGFRGRTLATLEHGVHRSGGIDDGQFTTAYFHRPEELRAEVADAGFHVEALYGIEGPGGYEADDYPEWADAAFRDDILAMARATETEPSLLGFGPHLLAVGRR